MILKFIELLTHRAIVYIYSQIQNVYVIDVRLIL
jgi:hypothetical protein